MDIFKLVSTISFIFFHFLWISITNYINIAYSQSFFLHQIWLVPTVFILCILQFSSSFLEGVAEYVEPGLPFISLSKGLELNTLRMMSQIIPQTLKNSRQPFVALSGPSFALELMNKLPTGKLHNQKQCVWLNQSSFFPFICAIFLHFQV